MKTIEQIIDKLEGANISVYEYEEGNKLCGYELNTYTSGGVNKIIFLDFRYSTLNPKNAKDFLKVWNDRIESIDVDEEIISSRQDKRYCDVFSLNASLQDFTKWKEKLEGVLLKNSKKNRKQRQFEQTVDKFKSSIDNLNSILELMPTKGGVSEDCQKMNILSTICLLDRCVNGIKIDDFEPNDYSGDFKLSF